MRAAETLRAVSAVVLRHGSEIPGALRLFVGLHLVSVCRIEQRKRHFGPLSPRAIFGCLVLPDRKWMWLTCAHGARTTCAPLDTPTQPLQPRLGASACPDRRPAKLL
jgi:hypothetical protein